MTLIWTVVEAHWAHLSVALLSPTSVSVVGGSVQHLVRPPVPPVVLTAPSEGPILALCPLHFLGVCSTMACVRSCLVFLGGHRSVLP